MDTHLESLEMDIAKVNAETIASLRFSLGEGEHGLSAVPGLIKKIIKNEMWKEFYDEVLRDIVNHNCFESFVNTPAPRGLGSSIEQLRRICSGAEDEDALEAIREEIKRTHGGDRKSEDFKSYNITLDKPQRGTDKSYSPLNA
jgi:hypothetical protein